MEKQRLAHHQEMGATLGMMHQALGDHGLPLDVTHNDKSSLNSCNINSILSRLLTVNVQNLMNPDNPGPIL